MGASKKLKMAMVDKDIKKKDVAEVIGIIPQTLYNMLNRDNMTFETVEKIADAIGCEVIIRDKESGKIYG